MRPRPRSLVLPGDELLPDARLVTTHGLVVDAAPAAIWPWLAQMGWGRAGFYAIDRVDNGGAPSARAVDPALATIAPGDLMPADGHGGVFEALVVDAPRALVLGGAVPSRSVIPQPLAAPVGPGGWRLTWAFVLVPSRDGARTLLTARLRMAGPRRLRAYAPALRAGHGAVQQLQLRRLARRVAGIGYPR